MKSTIKYIYICLRNNFIKTNELGSLFVVFLLYISYVLALTGFMYTFVNIIANVLYQVLEILILFMGLVFLLPEILVLLLPEILVFLLPEIPVIKLTILLIKTSEWEDIIEILTILILFLPIGSSISCGIFGRFIGYKGSKVLSSILIGITYFSSVVLFYSIGLLRTHSFTIESFCWIRSDLLHVNWSFLFDSLSVTMLIIVTGVSFLVHIYSSFYMSEDPHLPRFMSYLSLFTFFMIILVTSDNFLQLFLGWEGVGLCSYLLINFWFTRVQANKSAIKALIINKVGDYALFIAILLIFFTFKSVNFSTIFLLTPFFLEKKIYIFFFYFKLLDVICFLLFIGAVGKSAQIGLHTWLPDAMEGPTPVSALIHAATMVTAGIFLIVRCSPIFEYAPFVLNIMTIIGAITAFFAATIGLVQNDIKKIIAYSTCSQLGYMVFVCGTSNYSTGLFHLANHAFFKALLFLSAGSIIHSLCNEQDIRKMGGLINIMPFTYAMFLIGTLSLVGFPFLSGFYSKDVILELAYTKYTIAGTFAYWLGTMTAFFTASYSFRLLYYVFYSDSNSYKNIIQSAHESPFGMTLVLWLLSLGSIFSGYMFKDIFIGFGSDFFVDSIYTLPSNVCIVDSEFIPYYIKLLPTFSSLLGILISICALNYYELFFVNLGLNYWYNELYKFLIHKWYFDYIYNELLAKPLLIAFYEVSYKFMDKGFSELLGPKNLTIFLWKLVKYFRYYQTGFIYQYLCIMCACWVIIISFFN